jgi:hypothetical protein
LVTHWLPATSTARRRGRAKAIAISKRVERQAQVF